MCSKCWMLKMSGCMLHQGSWSGFKPLNASSSQVPRPSCVCVSWGAWLGLLPLVCWQQPTVDSSMIRSMCHMFVAIKNPPLIMSMTSQITQITSTSLRRLQVATSSTPPPTNTHTLSNIAKNCSDLKHRTSLSVKNIYDDHISTFAWNSMRDFIALRFQ